MVYGNNDNVNKVRAKKDTILEEFQKFMKNRLLDLRKLNLDSVSAQAALIESRNFFFKKNIKGDSIVESSLYKEFDSNIIQLGIASTLKEYTELSVKEALGLSYKEFLDMPIYYKKTIVKVLKDNIAQAEEVKKNARNEK